MQRSIITSIVYTAQTFSGGVSREKERAPGSSSTRDGEILTNNHVVGGSLQLTVTLSDKKSLQGAGARHDPRNDLALIKIDVGRKLPTLRLGDSDHLVVGQKVLAIGNPFGFEGTLTTGIVSSLDRSIETEGERARRHDPDRRRHQSGQQRRARCSIRTAM